MEHYSRGKILSRFIFTIVLLAIVTAAIVASYLLYKGNFDNITYSNWLFYASMLYILIGGLSIYGSTMSINNISHKYLSTIVSSNYEHRKKVDDMLINDSINFSLRMIAIGLILLLGSAAADKLL